MWEFHADWVVPASSTSSPRSTFVQTAPFDSTTCGYVFPTDCVPQPGTAQLITAIPLAGMFRFPYRNYGDREVLAGNFTVDANGADGVGIRWFILRADRRWRLGGRHAGHLRAAAGRGARRSSIAGWAAWRWIASATSPSATPGRAAQHFAGTATGFPSAMYTGRLASDPTACCRSRRSRSSQGQGVTGERSLGRLLHDDRRPGRRLHVLVHG